MTTIRPHTIVFCFSLLMPVIALGQSTQLCRPLDYKVLSDTAFLIKCVEANVSQLTLSTNEESFVERVDGGGPKIKIIRVLAVPEVPQWLTIMLAVSSSGAGIHLLENDNKYRMVLHFVPQAAAATASATEMQFQTASGSTSLCNVKDYKVLSDRVLGIRCTEADVSGLSLSSGAIFSLETADFGKKPIDVVSVTPVPDTLQWLLINLAPSASSMDKKVLEQQHKYRLVLQLVSTSQPPIQGKVEQDLDTAGTLSVIQPLTEAEANTYIFESHVGFRAGPNGKCQFIMQDYAAKPVEVSGDCNLLVPVPDHLTPHFLQELGGVGRLRVQLQNAPDNSSLFPLRIPGLLNVYAAEPKFEAKAQLAAQQAPATKDAASYYVKLDHAAGAHAQPAWVLEGRIAPPVGTLHRRFQFYPVAAADVGQNKVSGISYTDTINFGVTFTRVFRPNTVLQGIFFSPGITFETDKELDRDNLLANPDLTYYFAGLYAPRRVRTLREFSKRQAIAKAHGITLAPETLPRARLGYTLDFHSGTEIGGALRDTTVTASVGKATLLLPTYSIARVVPQIHGQIEIGNFTIDATGTPRYLATTENTVVEQKDHTLRLRAVSGWNAYGVLSGNLALDNAGHFSVNIAYKNGFSPPRFIRVNTVQTGLLLKY